MMRLEAYFAGGSRNLPWREEWSARAQPISIRSGEAVYPLTWRSEWSFHHADVCRFNRRLRTIGLRPAAPRLYPANNRLKSYGHRALARVERVVPAG